MSWLGEPQLLIFRGIGPAEIAIIAVVLLLLFGATRLPKIGSSLGHSLRAFKGALTGEEEAEPEETEGNVGRAPAKKDERS